jgi:hypothetical protein
MGQYRAYSLRGRMPLTKINTAPAEKARELPHNNGFGLDSEK